MVSHVTDSKNETERPAGYPYPQTGVRGAELPS